MTCNAALRKAFGFGNQEPEQTAPIPRPAIPDEDQALWWMDYDGAALELAAAMFLTGANPSNVADCLRAIGRRMGAPDGKGPGKGISNERVYWLQKWVTIHAVAIREHGALAEMTEQEPILWTVTDSV